MRYLIASDIHGAKGACEALLARARLERADRLVLLGDLLYHGPRNPLPADYDTFAVTRLLNELAPAPLCVRGNCDAEVDQMVLRFPVLADYALLPLEGGRQAFLTHGHLYNLDELPPMAEGDVLIHGHTHLPAVVRQGGITYLNPGSVGIPKEGNPPSYMLYAEGLFQIKSLVDGAEMLRFRLDA